MKRTKNNFKGRPDRACSTDSLRPAMNYIFINDGCMVATDGYILVKIPLDFSDLIGVYKDLDGYMIHRRQYAEILRYDSISIVGPGELKAVKFEGTTGNIDSFSATFKLKTQDQAGRYPDYQNVLHFTSERIPKVGVGKEMLSKLMSCFQGFDTGFRFEFQGKNKGIHFISNSHDGLMGLIMPLELNERI